MKGIKKIIRFIFVAFMAALLLPANVAEPLKETTATYDTYFFSPVGTLAHFPDIDMESQAIAAPTGDEPTCLPGTGASVSDEEDRGFLSSPEKYSHENSMVFLVKDKKTAEKKAVRVELIWCAKTEFSLNGQVYILTSPNFGMPGSFRFQLYKGTADEMEKEHAKRAWEENEKEGERHCKEQKKYKAQHPEEFNQPLYVKGHSLVNEKEEGAVLLVLPPEPEPVCGNKYYPKNYPE